MSYQITTTPTTEASTNPLGITFGTSVDVEFIQAPKKLLNSDVTGLQLTMIDNVGIYLNKGQLNAIIPWSAIISFIY